MKIKSAQLKGYMLFDSILWNLAKDKAVQQKADHCSQNVSMCVCVCVCLLSPSWLLVTLGDCSPPASSVHGIFHTRLLEWVAISCSSGSSWPRDRTCVPWIGRKILYCWATEEGFWLQTGTKGLFVEMQLFNIMIMEACKRNAYSCQNVELYI